MLKSPCVLVVDDSPMTRLLYKKILEPHNVKVLLTGGGREALELLKNSPEKPGVILLDLIMPDVDGWEFLKTKESHPDIADIPVVICSSAEKNIPRDYPYLSKPVKVDDLLAVVRSYCS